MPPGTISGFWDEVKVTVPAPGNQPVCPMCGVGVPYERTELTCVHGHRFFWNQHPGDLRFYPVVSNEYLLDYVLMSRWGLLGKAREPIHGREPSDAEGVD